MIRQSVSGADQNVLRDTITAVHSLLRETNPRPALIDLTRDTNRGARVGAESSLCVSVLHH